VLAFMVFGGIVDLDRFPAYRRQYGTRPTVIFTALAFFFLVLLVVPLSGIL
jgi:hypothetical protein